MKNILVLCFLFLGINDFAYAQGCSDAGICSARHSFDNSEEYKNTIIVASVFGTGESDVSYFSPYLSYTRKINNRFSLSGKVTYSSATGNLGTQSSFSDAFLFGNYNFKEYKKKQWSITTGWKIPFTHSNLKIKDRSLPLDYQASLGTFDWITGVNLKYISWDFNVAIQVPIFNNNKNSYFKDLALTKDFLSTNLFERKSDALFRTSYTFQTTSKKWKFTPNVLFIYHLDEDTFENRLGNREAIIGSKGLTINGNFITSYTLTSASKLEVSVAAPFLVRENRPDGLTRKFIMAIQYSVSF